MNGFFWPWALGLLILLPLFALFYRRGLTRRAAHTAAFPNAALLAQAGKEARASRYWPVIMYGLALAFGLVALARPAAKILVPDDMSGIMFAIETGRSMSGIDIQPNRLVATQKAAKALLERIPNSIKVGLATFAGYGSVNVQPTTDHKRIAEAIDSLTLGGSFAFTIGLIAALDVLPKEDPKEGLPGAIVLFSHGHDNTMNNPLAIAEEAAERGIKIHTIGVGTHGNNFSEDILKIIAHRTGGNYYPIFSADDLQNAHENLGQVITLRPKRAEVTSFASLTAALLLGCSLLVAQLRRRIF